MMDQGFLDLFNHYARSELLVLVPVLYIIGKFLAQSKVSNVRIPMITLTISIVLSSIYTFSTVPIMNTTYVLLALFTSVTQGILFAGASILGGIMLNPETTREAVRQTVADHDKANQPQ